MDGFAVLGKLEVIHHEMLLRNAYDLGLIPEDKYKEYIANMIDASLNDEGGNEYDNSRHVSDR